MNSNDAKVVAIQFLEVMQSESDVELAFNFDITEEHEIGYVFFYNTKKYWITGDFMDAIAGNGPILVRRENAEVSVLPSNQSVERSVYEFLEGDE
jgi:hypothetical protein